MSPRQSSVANAASTGNRFALARKTGQNYGIGAAYVLWRVMMGITGEMKTLLAAGAIALMAGGVGAATVSGTCSGGNKFVSLFSVEANDANNVFCQEGNPDYSTDEGTPELDAFGHTFTLAYKSAGGVGSAQEKGDNAFSFASFTAGRWELRDAPSATLKFLVGIKQGTTYAAFLVNAKAGTWFTANSSTSEPTFGISHYDLWYVGDTPAPIPLPAAGFLMIGALGGLAALRRRRRAV